MKELSGVALVLEGVICASRYRRACPRANQLYWRNIRLRHLTKRFNKAPRAASPPTCRPPARDAHGRKRSTITPGLRTDFWCHCRAGPAVRSGKRHSHGRRSIAARSFGRHRAGQAQGRQARAARPARRPRSACCRSCSRGPFVCRAGPTIDDALAVARRFADEGMPSTVSYYRNSIDATARQVADEYLASMDGVTASGLDVTFRIEPPAWRVNCELAAEMAAKAQTHGIRLHCDSHGRMRRRDLHDDPGDARRAVAESAEHDDSGAAGGAAWPTPAGPSSGASRCPRRQRRMARPADPNRDMGAGFLEVIDQLAGRASHVAVASHNVPLAAEAIQRLRAAGQSFELELLFGLPMTQSLAWRPA